MANDKWIKLGQIKKGKTGNQYLALGTPKSKFEPVNVEVRITDAKGNVLATATNPSLFIQNPRKRTGITEDQLAKIPEYVLAEVTLAPDRKVD